MKLWLPRWLAIFLIALFGLRYDPWDGYWYVNRFGEWITNRCIVKRRKR